LEEQAEPRIVEAVLQLLEKVAGAPRRRVAASHGAYAKAVLAAGPSAYWRLDEWGPPTAADASGRGLTARYEGGVAFHLPGAHSAADAIAGIPETPSTFSGEQINRAPHFAGGRLRAAWAGGRDSYSVELWVWNGLPETARPVTGNLVSLGLHGVTGGETLGIGGTAAAGGPGRLFFASGVDGVALEGGRTLGFRVWHHVVLVRERRRVSVYLDGETAIEGETEGTPSSPRVELFIGGRCDNRDNFEGKVDEVAVYEVAVYDRAVTAEEVRAHYRAAGRKTRTGPEPGMEGTNGSR
jgi:hypothetical protein